LEKVQKNGIYNYKKAMKFTEELQKEMKYKEEGEDAQLKDLSPIEMLAYEFIRDAEQPLAIRNMPHNLQGAVGKLKTKQLVEFYKEQIKISRHGFESIKSTKCVKIK